MPDELEGFVQATTDIEDKIWDAKALQSFTVQCRSDCGVWQWQIDLPRIRNRELRSPRGDLRTNAQRGFHVNPSTTSPKRLNLARRRVPTQFKCGSLLLHSIRNFASKTLVLTYG